MYEMYVRVTFKTSEVVHRFLCDLPYTFVNVNLHKGQREEDGKPCVTSVKTILFENNFRQTSPSFL